MSSATWEIRKGDAMEVLATMPDASVHCCVTSPPYWGLRNYGVDGAYGLEPTLDEYLDRMVEVFREVRRVLRDDGTLWLNCGDAYASGGKGFRPGSGRADDLVREDSPRNRNGGLVPDGLKPKDLIGLPWRMAFALQDDGWWLRSDIIWAKPNPMPESVTDRPTSAHEHVFLLTKQARYYYDADAVREPAKSATTKAPDGWDTGPGAHSTIHRHGRQKGAKLDKQRGHGPRHAGFNDRWDGMSKAEQHAVGANKRDVWWIAPQAYKEAHFATFPEKLVEPCILAGTSAHGVCADCEAPWGRTVDVQGRRGHSYHNHENDLVDGQSKGQRSPTISRTTTGWNPTCDCDADHLPATVLDPFCGSGTTGVVALRHDRSFVGIELNPEYVALARQRIVSDAPLLNTDAERSTQRDLVC